VTKVEAVEVHSTRAVIQSDMCAKRSSTSYSMEYALDVSSGLQWRTFAEGTIEPAAENHINECGATEDLGVLLPEKAYDIRIIGHNSIGSAVAEGQFTTPAVEAAEVLYLGIQKSGAIGPDLAELELEVEDNGAPSTCYEVKLTTGGGLVENGIDCVSEAEDVARRVINIKGLSPNTEYVLSVTASNGVGLSPVPREYSFRTKPATPEVGCCSVSAVRASTAHLSGQVVPDGSMTSWRLEEASSASASESEWSVFAEGQFTGGEADSDYHQIEGDVSGLAEEGTYYARVVAENVHGRSISEVTSFETAGRPAVMALAVHAVRTTTDGDVFRAFGHVVPHGYDTHVLFEYVPLKQWEACSAKAAAASCWVGASSSEEEDAGTGEAVGTGGFPSKVVGLDLPGVVEGKEGYRLRLVGRNAQGISVSGEQSVVVPLPEASSVACGNEALRSGASTTLADCRVYEQVTPSNKTGTMDIFKYGLITVGENVGDDGDHFMLHVPGVQWGPNPDAKQGDYFFSRDEENWLMKSVRPEAGAGGMTYNTEIYNENLTRVGVGAGWAPSQASASTSIELAQGAPGGPYTQLGRAVPRSKLGSAGIGQSGGIVAASGDFSKVVLQLEDHMFAGRSTGTIEGSDLYEVEEGAIRQVNVSPSGGTICAQGAQIASGHEAATRFGPPRWPASPHAVSADGSKVFFTDNCAHHLYMRVGGKETVDIGTYAFVAADAPGNRILLERSTGDTHEFFVYGTGSHGLDALPGFVITGPTESLIVSEDFTTVYFNSREALTPEAPTDSEGLNIYRYDLANHTLKFVANGGSSEESVSPNGRYLLFGAGQGGVSRSQVEGLPSINQVYRFDDTTNSVECISCASSFNPEPALKATFLGEPTIAKGGDGVPSPFVASADGKFAFFDTPSALVPQDIDGERKVEEATVQGGAVGELPSSNYSTSSDVYEWRGDGVDGCTSIGGCLSLISGGTGGYLVQFLGATPSGSDVFFATHEKLLPGDTDTAGDVYDARMNGGFPQPQAGPSSCEGDSCFSPVVAPFDATPASFAFSGSENPGTMRAKRVAKRVVRHCGKHLMRKARGCVRRAHRTGGARRAVPSHPPVLRARRAAPR
jgi:hypothetical protein